MSNRSVTLPNGIPVYGVPETVTDEQVIEKKMAELAAEEAMNPMPTDGELDPLFTDWAERAGPMQAGMLKMRQWITERIPQGIRPGWLEPLSPEFIQALEQQHPVASAVGDMYFPLASAVAAGSSIPVQAGLAGGLELMREGSTMADVGREAGLAGLGQGIGNSATRVASGIARGVKAARGTGPALRTTSQPLRLVGETGLGYGQIDKINQKGLLRQLGKIFGIKNMAKLDDGVLAQAADNIGQLYDDALRLPQGARVDVAQAKATLEAIDATAFPGKARLLKMLDKAADGGQGFRATHRALRDMSAKMKSGPLAAWADEVDIALGQLDTAASNAGADTAALRAANQKWKVLKTVEETPDAWVKGNIDPGQFTRKFGRESAKGFGTSAKRAQGQTDKLIPEVRKFVDDLKGLAADAGRGTSNTTERAITGAGTIAGGTALATGAIDPATAGIGLAAYGILPPLASAASVGVPYAPVGNVLNVAGRELANRE